MNLNQLIERLQEIKAEYGNLPEIYIWVDFAEPGKVFTEELLDIDVEERRTLILSTREESQ